MDMCPAEQKKSRRLSSQSIRTRAFCSFSSAFNIVDINLLLKRMDIIGLPNDIVDLVYIWLRDRTYYVNSRKKLCTAKSVNEYLQNQNERHFPFEPQLIVTNAFRRNNELTNLNFS